jgi:hypothetical protein
LKFFKKTPKNGKILKDSIGEQSLDVAIQMKTNSRNEAPIFRLNIQRLPSKIDTRKCEIKYDDDKIIIKMEKLENEPWSPYRESDFETIDLFKN